MKDIDWSKAPEGATHYGPERDGYLEAWFKFEGSSAKYTLADGPDGWHAYTGEVRPDRMEMLIGRSTWPESGLPPIGTECEAFNDHLEEWILVRVIDHQGSTQSAVCREIGTDKLWWSDSFRPAKTAEQIAEEDRQAQAKELFQLINPESKWHKCDHEPWLAAYDAGFRKQVTP